MKGKISTLIIDIGIWFVWVVVRPVLDCLPLSMSYFFADVAAKLFFLADTKRRNTLAEEIEMLYGARFNKKEVDTIVRKSLEIYLKRQVENLIFGGFTKDKLDKLVSIQGMEHLQESLQKGKGVILLTAHFGSFLLPLPVLGYKGYNIIQVAGKPLLENNRRIYRKLFEIRKRETDRLPISFIQTDKYLGSVVKALNKNEIIVLAFDGRTGNKRFPVQFLDRTAQFSPGPFNMALKTGAAIIPTFMVRDKNDKHTLILEPPFEMELVDNKEETLKMNTIKFARIFEKYLLNYPCHFGMILYCTRKEAERGLNIPLFTD
ncbi:MAG: lysophospholipid acyltransferase family protein [Candidatus Schekmanbacteria bacterium]|nr:lysophospholipid acyltransferase family protein [Candidatus Schekmanbacteria bacterium]